MRTDAPRRRTGRKVVAALVLSALIVAIPASPAPAGSGGTGARGGGDNCKSGSQAKISHRKAVPPCSAPFRVKGVIRAANQIATGHPYCYGGGHQSFHSSCYDCSGSVSYALHGGNLLSSPMPSSGLMHWGRGGRGHWITVYANSGHAYMTVAGLRFDTSMTVGTGPGWSGQMRSSSGYSARHHHRL